MVIVNRLTDLSGGEGLEEGGRRGLEDQGGEGGGGGEVEEGHEEGGRRP